MTVVLYEPFGGGGILHYTFELARGLAGRGVPVTVLTREDHELAGLPRTFAVRGGVATSRVVRVADALARLVPRSRARPAASATPSVHVADPGPGVRRLAAGRVLLWLELAVGLLVRRVRVVHVQWLTDPQNDDRFLTLLRRLGMAVVYTAHNVLPHESDSRADREAFQRIYRAADRIIVHAAQNRDELLAQFAVPPDRVAVVPHGAYGMFYTGAPRTKGAARAALGLPADARVVLFFGAIRRYKGLEHLVDAFRRVRPHFPDALLLVAGLVKTPSVEESRHYTDLIARLAREDGLACRSGYIPFDAVPDYFAAADVVALPYVKTYQSGVLALAYAAGRPVVVTDTGGLAEVVEPGGTGLVVPPGDVPRLAAAIETILADPPRAEAMGRRAKELADTTYAWDGIARRTLDIYRDAVAGRRRSTRRPRPAHAGGAPDATRLAERRDHATGQGVHPQGVSSGRAT